MSFWEIAYRNKLVTKEELKGAVITEDNPFGEITKEQYKEITGDVFA